MSKLSATLVIGDLIVPNGEWCDVIDTTVAGDLIVSGGNAGLRVAGSMIDGNLTATRAAAAADPLSSGADVVCNTVVCKHRRLQHRPVSKETLTWTPVRPQCRGTSGCAGAIP